MQHSLSDLSFDAQTLMDVFRRLALKAGDAIMDIYRSSDLNVQLKPDKSPVTAADQAADEIISAGLQNAFPHIALVTEEQITSHRQTADDFFIVDPLDGTKEFIRRRTDFTVNIAYVSQGQPRFGVVYAPAKARLFYTLASGKSVEEAGPFDKSTIGSVKPIQVSEPDNDALVVVASRSHRDQSTDDYIKRYAVRDVVGAGSSLKLCLVACGDADLYPRLGPTMEWDTAAGHAIVAGAGGHVVCFEDHAPLRYGKAGYRNPFFIAHSHGVELKAN